MNIKGANISIAVRDENRNFRGRRAGSDIVLLFNALLYALSSKNK